MLNEMRIWQARTWLRLKTKKLGCVQYLDHTVVPILMKGMQQLCREKPDDPVAYLAAYLLKHNPRSKPEEHA